MLRISEGDDFVSNPVMEVSGRLEMGFLDV